MTTYLSSFTVYCRNILVIFRQPRVDIVTEGLNKFHLWWVVIIKGIVCYPMVEFCMIIVPFRTSVEGIRQNKILK